MDRIPHSKPTLPEGEQWQEVTERLTPGWAADGPVVERFGKTAAAWLGCENAVPVSSGTNALHLALLAVGVSPESEVLVPAYCCAALLNAVQLAGARPVLVDCEVGGSNLCPDDARRRLTPRTSAIVAAHMFGVPCRTGELEALGVPLVEDCAQSLGAFEEGRLTGGRGRVAIASFYATKVITTGHGGAFATSDEESLASVRDMTHYDNREDWKPRFNYGMGEFPAALGLWQLERLPGFLARRADIARFYDEAAGRSSEELVNGAIAYRYVVRVPEAESVMARLQSQGIDAKRPVYRPLHHYLGGDYPHAQAAHDQLVSLPIYPTLTDQSTERVAAAVRTMVRD
jgi:perosamine synthetase